MKYLPFLGLTGTFLGLAILTYVPSKPSLHDPEAMALCQKADDNGARLEADKRAWEKGK